MPGDAPPSQGSLVNLNEEVGANFHPGSTISPRQRQSQAAFRMHFAKRGGE